LTTSDIANRLSLTHATVRSHRARVLRKLDTAGVVVALDSARKARRADAAIDAEAGCGS
jgi:DNA-binding CsgD family transcriptional regulator